MLKIKNLRGECQHCGGTIEFHAEHVGTMAACPHCGQSTELMLAAPPEVESPVRRTAILFAALAVMILLAGLILLAVLLKRAQSRAQPRTQLPPAMEQV